jgi:hypothetical protein
VTRDIASIEARVSLAERKVNGLDQKQAEVVKLQTKFVNSLGTQERHLGELSIQVNSLLPLHSEHSQSTAVLRSFESRMDAAEKRLAATEQQQLAFERQRDVAQSEIVDRAVARTEALADEWSKAQQSFREQLGEHAGSAARRIGAIEGEMEACRRQLSEMQTLAGRLPDLVGTQSSLQSRLDDWLAVAREKVERHISGATLRLHQHVEAESKNMDGELAELVNAMRAQAAEDTDAMTKEFEEELLGTVDDMKRTLDLELNYSSQELSSLVSTWQEGLLQLADSWAQHLESRPIDAPGSPHMARHIADGLSQAAAMLTEQLARRRSRDHMQPNLHRGSLGRRGAEKKIAAIRSPWH